MAFLTVPSFSGVKIHFEILRIEKKNFDLQKFNMDDIELLLVRFGEFLIFVFSTLQWYHLVQNCRFSGQN